jgi:2-hydroxy-6-oxonona-2,4-dienedioate hydrolase
MSAPSTDRALGRPNPWPVWRNAEGRRVLEGWHAHFLSRVEHPVETHSVSTAWGPSSVLDCGPRDAPVVVCLHAMRTGSAHLLSELQALAQRARLIVPDLPGQSVHGPPVRASLSDGSLERWLFEVLQGLDVGSSLDTFDLMGVSWGGAVARRVAAQAPGRVRRMVLLVPAGIANGSHWKGLTQMALPLLRYRLRPSEKNQRALLDPILTEWDRDWAAFMLDALAHMRMDPRVPPLASDDELRALEPPTLILGADQDISFPGHAVVDRVLRLVPNAEGEVLPHCKHCPPTTPVFRAWLAARVGRFLEEGWGTVD